MSLQPTKKWCEQHQVALSFPEHRGKHYVKLSKGDQFFELEYSPNEGNAELTLGEAVNRMQLWLDGGIAPLPDLP
jgi:hypothetical protein